MKRITRRFAAWLACFAVLAATLMPSLSHAAAAGKSTATLWSEICTAAGIKLVSGGEQLSPSSSPLQKNPHAEHCPFCQTGASPFGLPPGETDMLPAASRSYRLPPLFFHSVRPLFAWAAVQARAPPVAS